MTSKLIVNADGFGFGPGATQGIFDAIQEGGFVTSVSVNANFPEVERTKELAIKYPYISIGVHLNALVGKPCLPPQEVPTLVDENGFFHEYEFLNLMRKKAISILELEAEFDAQIYKVKKLAGDRLTHLDSQANSHLNYLGLFLKIARKWGIKGMRNNASLICMEAPDYIRSRTLTYLKKPHVWIAHQYRRYQMKKARSYGMKMADYLITVGYGRTGNKTNIDNWHRIIRNLPKGTFEIYCHPAYPDETLNRWASYNKEREEELEILCQKTLVDAAAEAGIKLISFYDI